MLSACSGGASGSRKAAATEQIAASGEAGIVVHGRLIFAFARDRVSLVRGDQIVARADAPGHPWDAAATLPGPDGEHWVVGISGGALWRVGADGDVEAAGDRLGIGASKVLSVAGLGTMFAIGLEDGVAVSRDGVHVSRFRDAPVHLVAAATQRIALGLPHGVAVYDLEKDTRTEFTVGDVSEVGFLDAATEAPRLVITSHDAIYIEDHGALRRVVTPDVHQTVVSGSRIWMLAGGDLYSMEPTGPIRVDAPVPGRAQISDAGGGGVWLTGDGAATRYTLDAASDGDSWRTSVAPIFERTCSKCHRADGSADLDLSTPEAWREHAADIRDELVAHDMPPEGTSLPSGDRELLERWVTR